jgi:hypothetical protein
MKAEAKINGHWYPVEVLKIEEIKSADGLTIGKIAQVKALPIDGWQPHPFTTPIGVNHLKGVKHKTDTGAIPVENLEYEMALA